MSEAELHVLQGRLRAGQLNKARRGEYFTHAPIGYVRSENTLVKDPDEQVRSFVEMLFSKFIELGSLSAIVRYLRDENLTVPLRDHRGPPNGQLQWKQPNTSTLLCLLHHPIYYGAYVYGRRKTDPRKVVKGKINSGRVWAASDQWEVLIEDKLPAYISKQQFEENQQKLWENAAKYRLGTAMRGTSMLAGRIVCGHCGRHMSVSYSWSGGFESRHRIMKPVQRFEWLESASEIRELIERRKGEGRTHAEVSEELNGAGYHSATCGAFTAAIASSLCKKFRDESQPDVPATKPSHWGLRELSHELGLRKETLNSWRRRGWVHATQESTRWTFWADEQELTRLHKLVDHKRQGLQKTPTELTTPPIKRN